MFNEINMALLGEPSWLRVLNEETFFVIGNNHSFLGWKTIPPEQGEFLMSLQTNKNTVLKSSALYTPPEGFLSNGKFRPRGKATAEDLTSEIYWEGMFEQALNLQQQYLNRPGCFTSLEEIASKGGSHPIYLNTSKSDGRRFIEGAAPTPDFLLYEWNTLSKEGDTKRIALIGGREVRVAQNIGANLILSDITTELSIEDILSEGVHCVLPRAVGEIEGTPYNSNVFMLQSHSCEGSVGDKVAKLLGGMPPLHGDPIVACWLSEALALDILVHSRKIYGSRNVLANMFDNCAAMSMDLNVELKQLNLCSFWPESCPIEANALDSLRYRGWNDSDLNEFFRHNCQAAWHTQLDFIMHSIEHDALRDFEIKTEVDYMKHLAQLTQDPEVQKRVYSFLEENSIK